MDEIQSVESQFLEMIKAREDYDKAMEEAREKAWPKYCDDIEEYYRQRGTAPIISGDATVLQEILAPLGERLHDEYNLPRPGYIGDTFSEPGTWTVRYDDMNSHTQGAGTGPEEAPEEESKEE